MKIFQVGREWVMVLAVELDAVSIEIMLILGIFVVSVPIFHCQGCIRCTPPYTRQMVLMPPTVSVGQRSEEYTDTRLICSWSEPSIDCRAPETTQTTNKLNQFMDTKAIVNGEERHNSGTQLI